MDLQLYEVRCRWQLKVGLNSLVWCFLKPWQSAWLSSTADPSHPHWITLTLCPDLSTTISFQEETELRGWFAMGYVHYWLSWTHSTIHDTYWINTNWFQLGERAWFWQKIKDSWAQHNTALHPPYILKDQLPQDGDISAHLHSFSAMAYSSTCSRVRDGRNGKQLMNSGECTLSQTRQPTCFPHGFLTWILSTCSYARYEAGYTWQIWGWVDARA